MPPKQALSRVKINSPDALKILLADGEQKSFFIELGDGRYRSEKVLWLDNNGTWWCFSDIEKVGSGYPTMEAMLKDSNIGLAINKGCFFYGDKMAMAA
jgi:hypothetical protein